MTVHFRISVNFTGGLCTFNHDRPLWTRPSKFIIKGGKKKKSKDEDGEPPGCNEKTLRKTYNIDDGMNVTTQEKKKRTNFQISCDNGLNPNFNFVTCKDKKGQIDFERFRNVFKFSASHWSRPRTHLIGWSHQYHFENVYER